MRTGLEQNRWRRGLVALLLMGAVLVGGASMASADGYGSDGSDCHDCPTPPPTTTPAPPTSVTPNPPAPHYGPSYPVPTPPPGTPHTPGTPPSPPVLARTGSNTGTLVGIGAAAVAVGGGLVLVARRRRHALVSA
jgi:LPXTG-motif cell wall-anchored protein